MPAHPCRSDAVGKMSWTTWDLAPLPVIAAAVALAPFVRGFLRLEHVRGEQKLVAGPVERRDERERCEGERKHDQRHPPAVRVARTSAASQALEPNSHHPLSRRE